MLLPSMAIACIPANFTDEERLVDAKSVYIGQVTGIRYDEEERNIENTKHGFITDGLGIAYTLRIYVTNTLKGKDKKVLEAGIACGRGNAALGDTVIVFKYSKNSFYVSNNKEMLSSVEKILGKALTTQSR